MSSYAPWGQLVLEHRNCALKEIRTLQLKTSFDHHSERVIRERSGVKAPTVAGQVFGILASFVCSDYQVTEPAEFFFSLRCWIGFEII